MSKLYSIDIILDRPFNEGDIQRILQRGLEKGFKYYDHIWGKRYEDSPLLDAAGATQKIMKARANNLEEGPCVYSILEEDSNAHLYFYESEDGHLEFHIGAIGCPKKKGYWIDFAYYIRMFLDLCDDFPILELKTTML